MGVRVGTVSINSAVFLAPMAGITDLPYRRLVSRFGAGLVVSEMVASQEMVQARASARARAELGFDQAKTAVQIAGREAYWMAECAKLCAGQGARIIDINMGCPAKKVTNGYSGSALMRQPEHALQLIEAVVAAVDVPVTLKMRLGWNDECLNAAQIAQSAEAAGVQMITIHGRTRCQFYKGRANWSAIGNVVRAVEIPVIANGDIVDATTADDALKQSGAAGVMVGRGAQGRPWLLAKIAATLTGSPKPSVPIGLDRAEMIIGHYQEMLSFYGKELGGKSARKHLGWYLDDLDVSPAFRRDILTETNPGRVIELLSGLSDARMAA